jgi:2-polyprenyl-3-methyl-5-hydroxy-6-metoxy-1,4-benzoquinol methylase
VKRGGYSIIGGGASVGNSALCLAYVMGFRDLHCFGYDSSHRDGASHAYPQPMNEFIPCSEVEWAGQKYTVSVAMKAQAEKFQVTARAVIEEGCKVTVHGDGLLPAMWNTPATDLTEKDKYRLMWQFDSYREFSPGEEVLDVFLAEMQPKEGERILDLGCGTGRAALKLHEMGHDVVAIDFADNCRDHEAIKVPFLECDLTQPLPIKGAIGLCTDVMEHIPGEAVEIVISNIMESCPDVFFQISTVNDKAGALIGHTLHNTVKPHHWWTGLFRTLGFEVISSLAGEVSSLFHIRRTEQ